MRSPTPLRPGDLVRLLAPSSPFDAARFERGRAILEARYGVSCGDALFQRQGYLAGDDAARLHDIRAALAEPSVRAIVAARGGYGATRLLPHLDPSSVSQADTWLVGFSDLTALHALWFRAGVRSVHGPMVCSLADASEDVQRAWFRLLEGGPPEPMTGLDVLRSGTARGLLFGGNLAVLCALLGTPYMPRLDDVVLVIEDVTERPYRVDRMLTSLLQSGALAGLRAVVIGQFTQCQPGADGVSARDVLAERLTTLDIPVVAGAPIGHVDENHPVLLGAQVEVDAARGTLSFLA